MWPRMWWWSRGSELRGPKAAARFRFPKTGIVPAVLILCGGIRWWLSRTPDSVYRRTPGMREPSYRRACNPEGFEGLADSCREQPYPPAISHRLSKHFWEVRPVRRRESELGTWPAWRRHPTIRRVRGRCWRFGPRKRPDRRERQLLTPDRDGGRNVVGQICGIMDVYQE